SPSTLRSPTNSRAHFAGPKPPMRSSPASNAFVDGSQTHETSTVRFTIRCSAIRRLRARLDDTLMRRCAGARRGVRLDSRQPSSPRCRMRRIGLAIALAVILFAPLVAEAQTAGKVYRIGFLGAASARQYSAQVDAMRRGLRDLGYVEGRNLTIDYRWADGRYERLAPLAVELVRLKVDVIVTHGTPGSQAAKQATTTIPIVMAVVGNPEEIGLVQSLARPGGNITGSSFMFAEVNAKRVQVLKDAVPGLRRVAALYNPDNFSHVSVLAAMEPMSRSLRLVLHPVQVRQADDFETAFARI